MHSFAYFGATLAAIAVFVLVLMLAESAVYVVTGQPVSVWAMVIAAISAAFGYAPLVQSMQRTLDRLFFRHQLDTLAAIRQLGAGDLAQLPVQDVETALLERICNVSHRSYAVLDERKLPDGDCYAFPANAPLIDIGDQNQSHKSYDLCLRLPAAMGEAYLWLGPRLDRWPMDSEERASLESLSKFSAMSLEHARLTHQQSEAARLDSLSRVTKQLHSHDLKNRLHDLSFLAHHLGSGKLDEEDVKRMLSAIRKVTGRMQTLMQRMSDPNAPVDPILAPLDLVQLLKSTVKERLWPESLTMSESYNELPAVAGDADLLQGVFENLYDNAVQAMLRQGEISIETRLVTDAKDVEMAQVRVSDQGCGISENFIRYRLFRLFATSKSNGLGVGLYLSKRIVEAHGGTIAAESEGAGKGSTFIVSLPLWQNQREMSNLAEEVT
ncbi:globin-coupled histidine kinase [Mariprofundus micogutta]|uniref:histidine kinase n=1 Tax=Mariprofundus micogutta TaxID=1921010 RepID=A0A1L8CPQ2_9PROT|nr:globin-coupled histidine kinase [Mariprofundus micogutta]